MLPTCVGSVMWILENKLISVLYLYIFNYEDPVLGQIFSSLIGHRYFLKWEEDFQETNKIRYIRSQDAINTYLNLSLLRINYKKLWTERS